MNHEARDKANEYALTVEWRGDDYGMRKQYYADAYLAGHAAAQKELKESLRVAGKAIQNAVDLFDTTNPLCADEITNLEKALAHLVKAGHYQLPCT
jgi:hypothetical protein